MDILKTIKRIIVERDLKKKSIAREMGLTPQQFSNLLKGKKTIKPNDIVKICEVLEISPNELFEYKQGA